MAAQISITLQEFKQMVQAIPNRNDAVMVPPPGAEPMPIATDFVVTPSGDVTYTIIGYLNWTTKAFESVTPQAQRGPG